MRRISLLRGLLEARTTRLPTSFSMAGTLRAWGRTQLWAGSWTFFELKNDIIAVSVMLLSVFASVRDDVTAIWPYQF